MPTNSLLQDVLRPTVEAAKAGSESPSKPKSPVEGGYADADSRRGVQVDHLAAMMGRIEVKRPKTPETPQADSSEEELIGVQTLPNTPRVLSRPGSRPGSRASSPSRIGASGRRVRGPLMLGTVRHTDPVRALPTEIGQRIFGSLTVKDLATCARVCSRWKRSQTLNYVWFQHYRQDNFQDDSLPTGKWTRRESKQDWRVTYLKIQRRSDYDGPRMAADADALSSGYVTPREMREAQWASEAAAAANPKLGKVEARSIYKELGGRKAKTKNKFGAETRDRGGWDDGGD
ncbi:F-box-like protein [Ceratobasidium sp. AG-Ba]|nr:F-box-like protein [Ceratobasidium sp. AG-Ba]